MLDFSYDFKFAVEFNSYLTFDLPSNQRITYLFNQKIIMLRQRRFSP